MRRIDLEAHFVTEEWVKMMFENKGYPRYVKDKEKNTCQIQWGDSAVEPIGDILLKKLLDLGEIRLREMDEAGVDMQVLSLNDPGCQLFDTPEATELAQKTNDELALVIQKYPDRFIGLAAVAPQAPEKAADELERAVKELGFRGSNLLLREECAETVQIVADRA